MRRLFLLCLLGLLAVLSIPALAAELAPLSAQDEAVVPGDPAWPLARNSSGPLRFTVALDAQAGPPGVEAAPSGPAGAFRIDFDLGQAVPGACACVGSSEHRNHYRSRGIEFAVRASRPLAGIIRITTSNTENRKAQDRFFGAFHVGTQWKVLRLPFRSLAVESSWPAEAARLGLTPGDLVLRPDSMEDIRIGVDAGRTEPGQGTLWVGAVRFFR